MFCSIVYTLYLFIILRDYSSLVYTLWTLAKCVSASPNFYSTIIEEILSLKPRLQQLVTQATLLIEIYLD